MNRNYKYHPHNVRFFKKQYYHLGYYYPDYYYSESNINHHKYKYIPDTEYVEGFNKKNYNFLQIAIIIFLIYILINTIR